MIFELLEKNPPSSRQSQLTEAREDFAFAHDNGITFEDLMNRINKAVGISWDRSATRRFILRDVIGPNHATKLTLDQVALLRNLGKQIRTQMEGVLHEDPVPSIQKDFFEATISLPLNVQQAQILAAYPELNTTLQAELQRAAHQVFQVFEMEQNASSLQKPKGP